MLAFLPFLEADASLIPTLNRIGPILVTRDVLLGEIQPRASWVIADSSNSSDEIIEWLDGGVEKVVLTGSQILRLGTSISSDRLILLLDTSTNATLEDRLRNSVSGVLIKIKNYTRDALSGIQQFFDQKDIFVLPSGSEIPTILELREINATLVIPSNNLTLGDSSDASVNIADAFLAPLTSDRPDGLFPTIVTSYSNSRSLGLVYSSKASVKEAILTGTGVYQSRGRGLWRKGETSGAVQTLVTIRTDCDSDALEFIVVQAEPGFCHLAQPSCFGQFAGLADLQRTLLSRLSSAPPGSYTQRLFKDPDLLKSKLREEADELAGATEKEDIAFEAADLLYFALVKCVANGVGLAEVEACLDAKRLKVTRRKGDAKPAYSAPVAKTNGVATTNGINGTAHVNGTSSPSPPPVDERIQMKSFDLSQLAPAQRNQLLQRPVLKSEDIIPKVKPIIDRVKNEGDRALRELTLQFDRCALKDTVIHAPFFDAYTGQCIGSGETQLDPAVRKAIDIAYGNVKTFHAAQLTPKLTVPIQPGVTCHRFAVPISRVGLYVPGGTAILPSTAFMLGVPAQVAGCEEIVIATPPRPDGTISPEVLYAAHLVGATAILKVGGAQAVAALAYGTESCPKVDKIFGPGNQWVTAAKMVVQNETDARVTIDMPAGPSEVLVIADSSSNPVFVAADLLSQAEHGTDSQVVLVGVDLPEDFVEAIHDQIDAQARALPRVDIVRQSISKSLLVHAKTVKEAIQFSNEYAPEHLILNLSETDGLLALVKNAGSVFVGPYTPESCGDYASGTNHTLPTNGFARQYSGVNTQSFQKHITAQEITAEGLMDLGPVVETLAECEGLRAHGRAVRLRLDALQAAA